MPSPLPQRIHVTGICGVATSAVAIAFHKRGVRVTGSDKGFYPPVSTYLSDAGVPYYAGWHPEKMIENGAPDFIMIGGVGTSPSNPELVYAREHNIPVKTVAETIGEYIVKESSVVVAGTWGKTTTSSLLSFILIRAGLDPSYFTGGLSLSHDTGALTESRLSVVEGDEYQISISDRRPKFAVYRPTHLLLTSVSWDHADLYPTRQAYFDEFKRLVEQLPADGLLITCADDEGVAEVMQNAAAAVKKSATYGQAALAAYRYHSVSHTRDGLSFSLDHAGNVYSVRSPMLGRFNAENIAACFAMAHQLGVPPETIVAAAAEFKGIKRRFEKRLDGDVTVLDCHAPTPEKAASVLASIREVYDQRIIAVYEPNIGGRQRSSAHMYEHAFSAADEVVIPRLTKLKIAENAEPAMESAELVVAISPSQPRVTAIDDDTALIAHLAAAAKKGDVIAFLGSHGFRGMIEEAVQAFR